jgi:hypothetical protein
MEIFCAAIPCDDHFSVWPGPRRSATNCITRVAVVTAYRFPVIEPITIESLVLSLSLADEQQLEQSAE